MLINVTDTIRRGIEERKFAEVKQKLRSMLGQLDNRGPLTYLYAKMPNLRYIDFTDTTTYYYSGIASHGHAAGHSTLEHKPSILVVAVRSQDAEILRLLINILEVTHQKLSEYDRTSGLAAVVRHHNSEYVSFNQCFEELAKCGNGEMAEIMLDAAQHYKKRQTTLEMYYYKLAKTREVLFARAAKYGNTALMNYLLDCKGFNVNVEVPYYGDDNKETEVPLIQTVMLMQASSECQKDLVVKMINNGVKLDVCMESGRTFLQTAITWQTVTPETLSILLQKIDIGFITGKADSILDRTCREIMSYRDLQLPNATNTFDSKLYGMMRMMIRKYVLLKHFFKINNIQVNNPRLLIAAEKKLRPVTFEIFNPQMSYEMMVFAVDVNDYQLCSSALNHYKQDHNLPEFLQKLLSSYPILTLKNLPIPGQPDSALPRVLVHKIAAFAGSNPLKAIATWYKKLCLEDQKYFRDNVINKIQEPWSKALCAALDLPGPEAAPPALTFSQAITPSGQESASYSNTVPRP